MKGEEKERRRIWEDEGRELFDVIFSTVAR